MRSPASPRSATSFKSPVAISLPSGILPGVKVFQLPPPALEARATLEASGGAGLAGSTGTGVAIATGEPCAAGAVPGYGAGVATGTFTALGGVSADATVMGVPAGVSLFWATTACAGVPAGAGDSSFCFLPFFPFAAGVAFASFALLATIGGVI